MITKFNLFEFFSKKPIESDDTKSRLLYSASHGELDEVKDIVEMNQNFKSKEEFIEIISQVMMSTALMVDVGDKLSYINKYLNIILYLLKKGANLNFKDQSNFGFKYYFSMLQINRPFMIEFQKKLIDIKPEIIELLKKYNYLHPAIKNDHKYKPLIDLNQLGII